MEASLYRRLPGFTDAGMKALRLELSEAAGRMTDDQVLTLADALHDMIRRRRGRRSFLPEGHLRRDVEGAGGG